MAQAILAQAPAAGSVDPLLAAPWASLEGCGARWLSWRAALRRRCPVAGLCAARRSHWLALAGADLEQTPCEADGAPQPGPAQAQPAAALDESESESVDRIEPIGSDIARQLRDPAAAVAAALAKRWRPAASSEPVDVLGIFMLIGVFMLGIFMPGIVFYYYYFGIFMLGILMLFGVFMPDSDQLFSLRDESSAARRRAAPPCLYTFLTSLCPTTRVLACS